MWDPGGIHRYSNEEQQVYQREHKGQKIHNRCGLAYSNNYVYSGSFAQATNNDEAMSNSIRCKQPTDNFLFGHSCRKHAGWIGGAPNYSEDYAVAGGNLGLQDSCAG